MRRRAFQSHSQCRPPGHARASWWDAWKTAQIPRGMSVVEAHELKLVARAQAVIVSVKVGILGVSARVRACERERATCAVESESTSMRRARRLLCDMGRARVGSRAAARSTSATVSSRRSCSEMRWRGLGARMRRARVRMRTHATQIFYVWAHLPPTHSRTHSHASMHAHARTHASAHAHKHARTAGDSTPSTRTTK